MQTGGKFNVDNFIALPADAPDYPPSRPVNLVPPLEQLREERRAKFLALLGQAEAT